MGIFAKFAAALVAIPSPVLGGMTTFLFTAGEAKSAPDYVGILMLTLSLVAVSGIAIITKGVVFTRRSRFILTAGLAIGYGATLVSNYFSTIFTYSGDNHALQGLLDAIVLIMETGFAVTAFMCMFLNLVLPEEIEETEETVPQDSMITGMADDGYKNSVSKANEFTADQGRSIDEQKRL